MSDYPPLLGKIATQGIVQMHDEPESDGRFQCGMSLKPGGNPHGACMLGSPLPLWRCPDRTAARTSSRSVLPRRRSRSAPEPAVRTALPLSIRPLKRFTLPMKSMTNSDAGWWKTSSGVPVCSMRAWFITTTRRAVRPDRKSTRLNSSHLGISYAVFCLEHTSELQSLRHLVCRLLLGTHVLTHVTYAA